MSLEDTLRIAGEFSDEYAKAHFGQLDSQRLSYLFRRNRQELDMVVRELWEELKESLFEPKDFEVDFGNGDGLPAISIPNQGMNAILRGASWTESISGSVIPEDITVWWTTKTGRKDFDYCDVFNGVGLQMLLYMFALAYNGETVVGEGAFPAGVQYFPARAPYLSSDGRLNEEDAEALRRIEWKRKGLLLRDEQVLQAMEPGDAPKRLCCSYRKDGSLSGDLADREQLKLLEKYVFRILGKLVEQIASGCVDPNPYTRGSSHSACAFCPYGAVCHKDTVDGRRNYKSMTAQRFWDEIGKEMDSNGR